MADKGNALTGARSSLMIQGTLVGRATGVSVGEMYNYEPLNCIGNIRVVEFVPTGYEVSISFEKFLIFGDTIKSNNWFPATGTTEVQQLQNVLTSGDLSLVLTDRKSNLPYATYQNLKITGHNYTVNARGVVGESCSAVAIALFDESDIF